MKKSKIKLTAHQARLLLTAPEPNRNIKISATDLAKIMGKQIQFVLH